MAELIKEEKYESTFLKVIKFIGNLATILMIILLVVVIFVFATSVRSGEQPSILNHSLFIVSSNSMSPEFETGSLLFVNMDAEALEVGDIITYKKPGGDISTTHRIVDIVEDNARLFITKGDANNINDPLPVAEEEVIGRVSLSIPMIGYAFGFMQARMRLLLFGLIPSIVIIFFIVKEIMKELERVKISL